MNSRAIKKFCALTACLAAGWISFNSQAGVTYAGHPKGFRGDEVDLTINAEAGTTLEAIDIVPEIGNVAGVLEFMGFEETPALTDGGSGLCTGQACSFFYLVGKTFAEDTVLATLKFRIDPAAPIGPVPFDAGVVVGVDPLPIPNGAGFEVLAIPEPGTWAMFTVGLIGLAGLLRSRTPDASRAC